MADIESVGSELYSNGKRVFIDGDSVLLGRYELNDSATVNLNDVTPYDGLTQIHNSGALPEYNYPEQKAGQMITWGMPSTGNITQMYVSSDNSNVWFRSSYPSWTSWKSVAFNTIGEIKLYTGKVVDIPKGWNVANGTKGTVDMSADFKTYGTDEVVYIQYTGGN